MRASTGIIAAVFAAMLLCGCGHGIDNGNGKKIGQVIQLGQHGWMCKTWEGKLVRGGFNTGSGVAGGTLDFTVEDPTLVPVLLNAMEKQQELEVTYNSRDMTGPCTSESDHFIRSVRILSETTPTVGIRPEPSEVDKKRQELQRQLRDLEGK